MTTIAHTHETARLQRIIDSQERELDHRADVISQQADEIARLHGELSEAMDAGSMFATALHWAMPNAPENLDRLVGLSD